MQLDPKSLIAGYPALVIRRLMKLASWGDAFGLDLLMHELGVERPEAQTIVDKLVVLGFVEKTPHPHHDCDWRTSISGNALAQAPATKPIHRKTAERILQEFVERVAKVNNDAYYLYRIPKVFVFGSYLSDADRLGDIDVMFDLESKEPDRDLRTRMEGERIRSAIGEGKRLDSIHNQVLWPQDEVTRFLRARNRYLSFHPLRDERVAGDRKRVIYDSATKRAANPAQLDLNFR